MKVKDGCTCKGCSLWLRLEGERFNKPAKPQPATKVITRYVTKKVYISNPTRDKLMFNAGRYAAGDRDSVAVKANEALNADL